MPSGRTSFADVSARPTKKPRSVPWPDAAWAAEPQPERPWPGGHPTFVPPRGNASSWHTAPSPLNAGTNGAIDNGGIPTWPVVGPAVLNPDPPILSGGQCPAPARQPAGLEETQLWQINTAHLATRQPWTAGAWPEAASEHASLGSLSFSSGPDCHPESQFLWLPLATPPAGQGTTAQISARAPDACNIPTTIHPLPRLAPEWYPMVGVGPKSGHTSPQTTGAQVPHATWVLGDYESFHALSPEAEEPAVAALMAHTFDRALVNASGDVVPSGCRDIVDFQSATPAPLPDQASPRKRTRLGVRIVKQPPHEDRVKEECTDQADYPEQEAVPADEERSDRNQITEESSATSGIVLASEKLDDRKKRGHFDDFLRQETSNTRMMGACLRCHNQRVRVSDVMAMSPGPLAPRVWTSTGQHDADLG